MTSPPRLLAMLRSFIMLLLLSSALLVGFLILFRSADQFVIGAVVTARNLDLSPMLIGLTIVSLGTSAPEIFVAVTSSVEGVPDLAVGNAIGSNIANIGLVLGITAMLVPLPFRVDVRRDLHVLIIATLCAGATLVDGYLGIWDGLLLLAGLILFLFRLFNERKRYSSMETAAEISEPVEIGPMSTKRGLLILGMSLVMLVVSSELLVWAATEIAVRMGVDELIIGLTIIAVGTSIPELVVSVSSATKGHTDIAIGNIIGSNIFNIFAVLTIPCLIAPTAFGSELFWRDYLLMFFMTCLLVLFAYGGRQKAQITRVEGGFFFLIWVVYLVSIYYSALTNGQSI